MDSQTPGPTAEPDEPRTRPPKRTAQTFVLILLAEALVLAAIDWAAMYVWLRSLQNNIADGTVISIVVRVLYLSQLTVVALWLGAGQTFILISLAVAAATAAGWTALHRWLIHKLFAESFVFDRDVFWELLAVSGVTVGMIAAPLIGLRILNFQIGPVHVSASPARRAQFSILRIVLLTAVVAGVLVVARLAGQLGRFFRLEMHQTVIESLLWLLIGGLAARAIFSLRHLLIWLAGSFVVANLVAAVRAVLAVIDDSSGDIPYFELFVPMNGAVALVLLMLLPFRLAGYRFRPPPKRVPQASVAEPPIAIDPLA